MQAFKIHKAIVDDYKEYLNSFTTIRERRIRERVQEAFATGTFLPEPLLQFNPSLELGESLHEFEQQELEGERLVHEDLIQRPSQEILHGHLSFCVVRNCYYAITV